MVDKRLEQLKEWLKFALEDENYDITVASADASFRRYFRVVSQNKTWIAMDAPPDKEDCKPFVKVATAFHHMTMNVPEIYAQDLTHGFLVLTDFGNTSYLDRLNSDSADALYSDAMNALIQLQTHDKPHNVSLPQYDRELLDREMRLFSDWFLAKHLNYSVTDSEKSLLEESYAFLAETALSQDKVWVHRDYHSRNLMVLDEGNPGVIDFQDAVEGPITYDLASLLRDCYIDWPIERVESWVKQYYSLLQSKNGLKDVSFEKFLRWFDLMGAQRHLKAIGIFSRLNYRDGKSGYLNDIPRTLNYVRHVAKKYVELKAFGQFIEQVVVPRMPPQEAA